MKRLIIALRRYAMSEEYIVSYAIADLGSIGSKGKLDFYFQTINSKEDEFHHIIMTDIPKRVSSNDIDNAIKTISNAVRELEKKGE